MTDEDIEQIFAKSVDPDKTAERLAALTGRHFIVEKVDDGGETADDIDLETADAVERERQRDKERRRRALAAVAEAERVRTAAVTAAGSPPNPTKKELTMIDLTAAVREIVEKSDARTATKLAEAEIGRGASVLSSYERSAIVTAIAKAHDRGKAGDDQKAARFMAANNLFFKWAMLRADVAELAKRDTLLDDTFTKTVSLGAAPALGDREALAVGRGSQGAKPTEADRLRERIIADKMTAAPWMTAEQLGTYATGMLAELDRLARTKQNQTRPGTLERV